MTYDPYSGDVGSLNIVQYDDVGWLRVTESLTQHLRFREVNVKIHFNKEITVDLDQLVNCYIENELRGK